MRSIWATLEHSEIDLSQENEEFSHEYFAISAEPTEENQTDLGFSLQDLVIQNLVILTNINEVLQNPIWKNPWMMNMEL